MLIIISATKRSDKYLADIRQSKKKEKKTKKSKKKSKKNRGEDESEESDEDPKPLHTVNTQIEMPEGAVMSDTDEKND